MSRPFTRILVVILILVLMFLVGIAFPLELVIYLVGGWVLYLRRVAPEVSVDWATLMLSCGALLLFTFGLHFFLSWLRNATLTSPGSEPRSPETGKAASSRGWKFRWTASAVAIVLVLFVAGISATGIVHQIAWWASTSTPTFAQTSEARYRARSINNAKQIGIGNLNYIEANNVFPLGATMTPEGEMLHGWLTFLLPFVEEAPIHDQIRFNLPWNHPSNREALVTEVDCYQSGWPRRHVQPTTTEDGYWLTDYASNVHVIGGTRQRTSSDLSDGAGNTILSGEAFSRRKPWGHPANWRDPARGINRTPDGFGAPWSSGGANFTYADGSARFLSEDIDPKVLKALSTPNGGESLNEEAR
ncbi:DUF1559 domain-containing protein [Pirellulales bacterium]|nr:DUF1559 domain-containing protein [Pirellulales bacterium]